MKVLIKENSLTFRIIFSNYFNKLNFEVVFLEENQRILEFFENSFDLYLFSSIDETETLALVTTIREFENKNSISNKPILFCANDLDLQKKLEYLNLGINFFLKKPFTFESLQNILKVLFPNLKRWEDLQVLIAEDSEPTRKVLKIYLSKHKLKITLASDGKEAMQILADRPNEFHLIITDLNMPNMNGLELAKVIRYVLGLFEIPIIFLSAEDEAENTKEFLSFSNGWIRKPFSPDIVNQILPYLEIAEKYKKTQELNNKNQFYNQFIQTLYHKFENSCALDLKFSFNLIHKILENKNYDVNSLSLLEKLISESIKDFQILHEFLLENSNFCEFQNTIRFKQFYDKITNNLKTILEYKKLKLTFKTEVDIAILKINSIFFEFIFLEILTVFIILLKENQKLVIHTRFEEKFLCIKFLLNQEIVIHFPNWIFEKTNLSFSKIEEQGSEVYLLKFDLNE